MNEDRPSITAYRVAMRRAAHQILDAPKVFEDPLALPILGPDGEARLREGLRREQSLPGRALRAFVAVRSRYSEDTLAGSFENGVRSSSIRSDWLWISGGWDSSRWRTSTARRSTRGTSPVALTACGSGAASAI
jgi:hypothetical protein